MPSASEFSDEKAYKDMMHIIYWSYIPWIQGKRERNSLPTTEAAWNQIPARCLGLMLGFSHDPEEYLDGLGTNFYEVDLV